MLGVGKYKMKFATVFVLTVLVSFAAAEDCDECGYTKSAICETATVIMDACLKATQGNQSLCQTIVSQVNDQTEKIVKNVYDAHWDFTGFGGWSCNVRAFNWPTACDDTSSAAAQSISMVTIWGIPVLGSLVILGSY